ncbi:MAG: DNA translocase FtsK 4TM domain-containing protein [Myxococcales bacterium]|nr:DNA translocase FtsK 4TM domain-containing protein [Myxococcales bacterium]MCB9707375.1 DNA translocase FtsK 4TM domain-containing protein [Myxococcales bacterium]
MSRRVSKAVTTDSTRVETAHSIRHEISGVVVAAMGILMTLALWSYDARGSENLVGPVGNRVSEILVRALGFCAWLLPIEMLLATLRLFGRRSIRLGAARAASTVVLLIVGCALFHLMLHGEVVFGGQLPGGVFGELLGEVSRSLLGTVGSYIVGVVLITVTLLLRTSYSLGRASTVLYGVLRAWAGKAGAIWQEAKELEEKRRQDALDAIGEQPEEEPKAADTRETVAPGPQTAVLRSSTPPTERAARAKIAAPGGPIIVPPKMRTGAEAVSERLSGPRGRKTTTIVKNFILPATSALDPYQDTTINVDEKVLKNNATRLVQKLEAYGVAGRVDEIHPGPVVTMYEFEPASGTKVSKIASLADDLAMALAAQKVRIVAPIVGKARVGFELPNARRQTVSLRDILEDERWHDMEGELPIALGKDIMGQPVYADLSKMPHLLVAGATGSGKSVGLNVMLASMLFKKTPEELRLLMIDPKVVELAAYDGIPHMLLPVVTDMRKAALSLRWAVDEMERRYQLFADAGARNVQSYNERVDRVLKGTLSLERLAPRRMKQLELGETTDQVKAEKLPHIVVVVDEFADLIMVAAKDVEAAITRLAQKARAAGIHVILATQRPSVDVITGVIKANFPTRIAFKVSQREDSKTILGRSGAEHLLGMGDMLMLPPGTGELKRVHSAYISEDELKAVCDFLRAQGSPVYDERILKPRDEEGGDAENPGGSGSDDDKYDRAVAIVSDAGYCSISHIQRQLGVGYNKAAKLVERMEKDGVVGPPSGKAGGRREVLIQSF